MISTFFPHYFLQCLLKTQEHKRSANTAITFFNRVVEKTGKTLKQFPPELEVIWSKGNFYVASRFAFWKSSVVLSRE
jgi:hypothetical protein